MKRGFPPILATQFFTALADNGLVFAAIALLQALQAPAWQVPALQQSFVVAFILLAPFVGHLADSLPKGQVMVASNLVKIAGCAAMLIGVPPLLAYACVGTGAAMYSPAKYGILAELFPTDRLVWANGWMEGVTVLAIILGAIVGGMLVGESSGEYARQWQENGLFNPAVDSAPQFAIAVLIVFYTLATLAALAIPRLPGKRRLADLDVGSLTREFGYSLKLMGHDPPGLLAIIVTSLVWGTGTTLRFVILVWSAQALQFDLEQGAQLTALVVVGVGMGAAWAGLRVHLAQATRVLRAGIAMGLAIAVMAFVSDWRVALPLLLCIGALGGYLVVPMNALLQHRGYMLMGAGHSIALQNLGENLTIISMLGVYALLLKVETPVTTTILLLGLAITALSGGFVRLHGRKG